MVISAQEADTVQVTKQAKERAITGTLVDKESKEGIMQVTIQLLKTDSTYVAGSVSDMDGHFTVKAPENGKYILKMSVIGYKTMTRDITISNDNDFAFGRVNMRLMRYCCKGGGEGGYLHL